MPKPVRDALGLVPGQKLAFIHNGSGIRLVPQTAVADLVGIARGANTDNLRCRDSEERLLPPPAQARKRKRATV